MALFFSPMTAGAWPRGSARSWLRCGVLTAVCLLALVVIPVQSARAGQAAAPLEQSGSGTDGTATAGSAVWPTGARFPDIALGVPSPDAGWTGGPDVAMPEHAPEAPEGLPAHLSDLRGQVFIVNMYSWFCAPCQEEAPALRALHALIASAGSASSSNSASSGSSDNLAGRVRLVGIAAGDDWNLVQAFRQRHGLTFPLFADPELALHGQLGGLPVPFTWVLRRKADGFRVLFTHAGALSGTPAEFLDRVLAAAGALP
ncbi:TlpA family protein disulfide reductase [Nitratidesulfovibrio termitidis]|uniref:TlpA family protein disulfide reductase n=1 Tax=Nitratidesulfovibrio termitidis TaxID=42252 RepID=UPI0004082DCD|nr:TlpA disulfide reductase family protein [Nitratidesulfovibrio termitidis]